MENSRRLGLTLLLIALIHSNLVIKFRPDLIEKFIETRRILRHAAMSRIHGHFGGCGARPSVASNDQVIR